MSARNSSKVILPPSSKMAMTVSPFSAGGGGGGAGGAVCADAAARHKNSDRPRDFMTRLDVSPSLSCVNQWLERGGGGAERASPRYYWGTGTGDRQPSRTDMEAVLRQALLSTDKQIAGRSAIVTHDPLPVVVGDFEILTKVLHHLIRNAIEYCGAPSPRVHISSGRADLEWVFSVQDHGPGIDPAFQGRL